MKAIKIKVEATVSLSCQRLLSVSECDCQVYSQDLIVAQGLSGRAAIPAAVWDVPIGRDDVEGVVDEVVLEDAVVCCAGSQRGRGVHLRTTQRK